MNRVRKIFLYVIIVTAVALEIYTGYWCYAERGVFFGGIAPALFASFTVPAIIGLLLGVREGIDNFNKDSFFRDLLVAISAFLLHTIAATLIFTIADKSFDLNAINYLILSSFICGYSAYFAALLIIKLIRLLIRKLTKR